MAFSRSTLRTDGPFWLGMAIAILIALQATMIFTRAINWDEFFFYSQFYAVSRGELVTPLNTVHTRLFAWLPGMAANSVDAIVMARIAMFACELVTLAMIAVIARRFTDLAGALLAALCYISAGFVLQHGFSFRVDPMVTAALMIGLAILVRSRLSLGAILGFGLAVGFGAMVTIKAVLFAPAFLGLAWLRWSEQGRTVPAAGRLIGCAVAALATFGLLYLLHAGGIAQGAASGGGEAVAKTRDNMVAEAGSAVFFIGIPPYLRMIRKAVLIAPFFAALIVAAPFAIALAKRSAAERFALAGLWAPLLTLLFYRNTAPYYYVFMLAPVAAACVPAIDLVRRRFGVHMIAIALFALAAIVWTIEDREAIGNQRQVVAVAEQLFDRPTDYFDHNGMLAPHRKANMFMTPWGLEGYRHRGRPVFRQKMEARPVPLLLENDILLTDIMRGGQFENAILAEDRDALRDNYVAAWGPVWLAGKPVDAGTDQVSEFLVPGRYRVESSQIEIDGRAYAPGEVVSLQRGSHRLANAGTRDARVVWADHRPLPTSPPPEGEIWIGF